MRRLEIARHARRDIDLILWESLERHGPGAAARYRRLIDVALAALREDPARPGSRSTGSGDLHLYALRIAARGLTAAETVHAPPHVVVYRFDGARVEIVRLLHSAMDLPWHLERALGTAADDLE